MDRKQRFLQSSQIKQTQKRNPFHSYLYKQYREQVININALQLEIKSHKNYLNIRGNYFKSKTVITQLNQTREKLKYHQSIAKYLKQEIQYYNYQYNNVIW